MRFFAYIEFFYITLMTHEHFSFKVRRSDLRHFGHRIAKGTLGQKPTEKSFTEDITPRWLWLDDFHRSETLFFSQFHVTRKQQQKDMMVTLAR